MVWLKWALLRLKLLIPAETFDEIELDAETEFKAVRKKLHWQIKNNKKIQPSAELVARLGMTRKSRMHLQRGVVTVDDLAAAIRY